MPEQVLLERELPCDVNAPADVREALSGLGSLGWAVGDVLQVASELVGNAVRHSGCRPGDHVQVSASLQSGLVRIAVRDPGRSGDVAHVREPEDFDDGGLGLMIVDQLSQRWGAERADGYLVWAEVALATPAPESRAHTARLTRLDGHP